MSNNDQSPEGLKLVTREYTIMLRFNDKQVSVWNTCVGEAIRKAKLSSTLIPIEDVKEIISELEYLKFLK